MIYVDIDGVLADSDGYLEQCEPRALKDTHLLFKTIYKYHKTVFKESKPLVDLNFLKDLDDFCLLTALPNKANIDSFCENVDEVMSVLENNKKDWVNRYIGDCKLRIVSSTTDKLKYCVTSDDILIDDNKKTGKRWQEKGGRWFPSVEAFLKRDTNMLTTKKASVKVSVDAGFKADLW